jgi:hypothetical protein
MKSIKNCLLQAITTCVEFYLKTVGGSEPELEVSDDDDDDDDIIALPLGRPYNPFAPTLFFLWKIGIVL